MCGEMSTGITKMTRKTVRIWEIIRALSATLIWEIFRADPSALVAAPGNPPATPPYLLTLTKDQIYSETAAPAHGNTAARAPMSGDRRGTAAT